MGELRNPLADRWDLDKGIREQGLWQPFPRRITFADLDSETEIHGQYLDIEGKREGQEMPYGQWKTYCERVRDGRTVLLIYGDPPYDVRQMFHFKGGADPVQRGTCIPATLQDVLWFCTLWARWADKQPYPEPRPSMFPADDVMAAVAAFHAQQAQQAEQPMLL
jgi:hypothetical protein